ncbi:hypothetical protein Ciccas_006805, partial [Cichlidogyrus casuarinus]
NKQLGNGFVCEALNSQTGEKMARGLQVMEHLRSAQSSTIYQARIVMVPNPPKSNQLVTFTVSVLPQPVGPITYTWKFKGQIQPQFTGNTYRIERMSRADVGRYECTMRFRDHTGAEHTLHAIEDVMANRSQTQTMKPYPGLQLLVDEGKMIEFHCDPDVPHRPGSFQWFHQGRPISFDHRQNQLERTLTKYEYLASSIVSIKAVSGLHVGTWKCSFLDEAGRTVDRYAILKLSQEVRVYVEISPTLLRKPPNRPGTFHCKVTNADPREIQWKYYSPLNMQEIFDYRKAGELPPGWRVEYTSMSSFITKNSLATEDNGFYACILNNLVQSAQLDLDQVETATCANDEYTCSNGDCISRTRVCDSNRDCPDGSDETNCNCDPAVRTCKVSRSGVQPSKKSYNVNWECDGEDDCGNGYDESDCFDSQINSCYPDQKYSCQRDNRKIPLAYMCDGTQDCNGGDDENGCMNQLSFQRIYSNRQVSLGGTVSMNCTISGRPPPRVIWRWNWKCLPGQAAGESQTPFMGSNPPRRYNIQTRVENCERQPIVTSILTINDVQPGDAGIFNCEALHGSKRTRLILDPTFNSVNVGELAKFTCSITNGNERQITWKYSASNSTHYNPFMASPISPAWTVQTFPGRSVITKICAMGDVGHYACRYDQLEEHGYLDIKSEELEFFATKTEEVIQLCGPNDFMCSDSNCIDRSRICDGRRDCTDGGDEQNCDCDPAVRACKASRNGVQPKKKSYNVNWECDGEDDCGNGYDESDCMGKMFTSCFPDQTYRCKMDNRTIPVAYLCDGSQECTGGDDEANCLNQLSFQRGSVQKKAVRLGDTVTFNCTISANPPPRVIWRWNWKCLPGQTAGESQIPYFGSMPPRRYVVTNRIENCGRQPNVISTLTINGFTAADAGIFNCEALLASKRTLSEEMVASLL